MRSVLRDQESERIGEVMGYPYIKAKSISYGSKRALSSVRWIVIHNTGNVGDTAEGNCRYFASGNQRQAGAHFFVDQKGNVVQSIPMGVEAWSVGGFFTQAHGAGKYYNKCINRNSVSIELCDIVTRDPSDAMVKAVKELVRRIRLKCKNADNICTHWQVNGKNCPARMTGNDNPRWLKFKKAIEGKADSKTDEKKKPDNKQETGQKITNKTLKVGATIRIRKGANQYGKTKGFASFVYDRKYTVKEIRGNRVVFADGKIVMGAVAKKDCKVV